MVFLPLLPLLSFQLTIPYLLSFFSSVLEDDLDPLFEELDEALSAFKSEMVASDLWNSVTVILVSEFGRTLMGNSGNGRYVFAREKLYLCFTFY